MLRMILPYPCLRYTPLDQLTPEELAEFTTEHFTLGKIPERPPPKEFCIVAVK